MNAEQLKAEIAKHPTMEITGENPSPTINGVSHIVYVRQANAKKEGKYWRMTYEIMDDGKVRRCVLGDDYNS